MRGMLRVRLQRINAGLPEEEKGGGKMTCKVYVLTEQVHRTMTAKGWDMHCRRCGKLILPEEKVVRQQNGNRTKRYHLACWESMFI